MYQEEDKNLSSKKIIESHNSGVFNLVVLNEFFIFDIMEKIQIYCDSRDAWIDFVTIFNCTKNRDIKNQPFISFVVGKTTFEVFADFTNTNLPIKVKDMLILGCRVDYIFYNPNEDKIILLVEDTKTAPVGNAQKQRISRPILSWTNKIPFIYVSPEKGKDASLNQTRTETGVFKELKSLNKESFISNKEFNLKNIINEIIKFDLEKYIIKNMIDFEKSYGRTRPKVSGRNSIVASKLKEIIFNDKLTFNIFEEKGSVYLTKKSSDVANFLGIDEDFILVIGSPIKKSGGFSDPFCGQLHAITLLNNCSKNLPIIIVSTNKCDRISNGKIKTQNNKLTQCLQYCTMVIDNEGKKISLEGLKYICEEIFEYKEDGESIATFIKTQSMIKEGDKISFTQFPHGSWGSNDGLNANKRDEKRPDIISSNRPNGVEVKKYLSDVYKHIEDYGILHDEYVYIYEDCNKKNKYNNIIIERVNF